MWLASGQEFQFTMASDLQGRGSPSPDPLPRRARHIVLASAGSATIDRPFFFDAELVLRNARLRGDDGP